jgi:hypothetical protein
MALLRRGTVSLEVRKLQVNLNQIQKPVPILSIDGIFGPITEGTVRAFQKEALLDIDGIVGPKTQDAIQSRLRSMPSITLSYVVPGLIHIEQDKKMSCWFASAQMLIQWKRTQKQMTDPRHPDPSDSIKWSKVYRDDTGISNSQIQAFARDMGFQKVPPMSPTPEAILGWLRFHGPLWVNGVRHITVIGGIRGPRDNVDVLVLDPANKGETNGSWRNLRDWYVLDGHSGRDTSDEVTAVFLRLP